MTNSEAHHNLPESQTRHFTETAAAREALLGPMVTNEMVSAYLTASALAYEGLCEAEYSRAGDDKYAQKAARQYRKFAQEDLAIANKVGGSGGLQSLDGMSCRSLVESLTVVRDILRDGGGHDTSGLETYLASAKKRWQEAINQGP
jgi:hypothetical protein